MSIIEPDAKTSMTRGHMELLALLANFDYIVEEEVSFPPYTVDCYIEKLHVAFEFDGPHHSGKHDSKRDARLMIVYALPVIRVESEDPKEMMRQICIEVLETWGNTAEERRVYGK